MQQKVQLIYTYQPLLPVCSTGGRAKPDGATDAAEAQSAEVEGGDGVDIV